MDATMRTNTDMEMGSIIEKIKKCLSLASNNSSENEVKVALKMAQAMAFKANICIDDINYDPAANVARDVIKEGVNQTTKTCPTWRYHLCKIIADNFRTAVYMETSYKGSQLKIIGTKDAVAITKEVFAFTENAYLTLSKKYLTEMKKEQNLNRSWSIRLKNDYLSGYTAGLKAAFAENITELGLIIVKPEAVSDFIDGCKTTRSSAGVRSGNQEAINQGHADGQFIGSAKRGGYIN